MFRGPNCSLVIHRDWNSFGIIEELGLEQELDLTISQSSSDFSLFRSQSGAKRIAVPVETSTTTRNKAENDDLLATLSQIPFIRASAVKEAGSPSLNLWNSPPGPQALSLG
jgi:hypothetical protein